MATSGLPNGGPWVIPLEALVGFLDTCYVLPVLTCLFDGIAGVWVDNGAC